VTIELSSHCEREYVSPSRRQADEAAERMATRQTANDAIGVHSKVIVRLTNFSMLHFSSSLATGGSIRLSMAFRPCVDGDFVRKDVAVKFQPMQGVRIRFLLATFLDVHSAHILHNKIGIPFIDRTQSHRR
jgi:hypothetical protein